MDFSKILDGIWEPVLTGHRVPIWLSEQADFVHLCSPDDTIFGCLDDWTHPAYSSTPLSTKFLDFTVVLIYINITMFNISYLLYTCYNVDYHFTSLTYSPLQFPL